PLSALKCLQGCHRGRECNKNSCPPGNEDGPGHWYRCGHREFENPELGRGWRRQGPTQTPVRMSCNFPSPETTSRSYFPPKKQRQHNTNSVWKLTNVYTRYTRSAGSAIYHQNKTAGLRPPRYCHDGYC